ncbi:hypothetical protein BGX38DRAFT_1264029 [Terfezia claveryi]|nr:hypothetical protein BGX38DRAFT_1264029 [Terfezia claveryi]
MDALSELSKLGNEANTAIHSVTISQVLHTISVFNKYHTQPNRGPLPSPLRIPSRQCLGVLTTILKHILGVAVGEDLPQQYKDDSQSLGDMLDSYSTQTNFHELEPMKSVRLDWIPTWDEKHWGKVVAVAASLGLAVPQQKHQQELKEADSDVQRAKEAAEVSEKETIANKEKIRTLRSEVKDLKKRVKRLEGENEKLKAENEAIKAKNRNIEADYAVIKAENAAIKAENAAIKAENAAIKAENAILKAENVALKKRIDDMEIRSMETNTFFMAQFAIMKAEIASLRAGNAPQA